MVNVSEDLAHMSFDVVRSLFPFHPLFYTAIQVEEKPAGVTHQTYIRNGIIEEKLNT